MGVNMKDMLSRDIEIPASCQVSDTEFGIYTELGENCYLQNSRLDDYSYIGQYCMLQNTEIGKFSNIAAMVRIGPTAHPMERPTLHHFTYRRKKYGFSDSDDEGFFEKRKARVSSIGHDTWIGHGAIIMPGVTIGHGSVVGAGAVVTRNVPDYSLAVGCPAIVKKERFKKDQVNALLKIKWWDWTYDQLKERLNDFYLPIDEFIGKYR
jgi:phosphonate metabolism protein (transferase hexapeptide repeat family)